MSELTPKTRRRTTGPSWSVTLSIVLLLVAVLLGVGAWFQQKRFESAGREVATQIQTFSSQLTESRRESKQALSLVESHAARIAELEVSMRESQSQFSALEHAWDSFNNGMGDSMLANDMERLLTLASQQLRLAGNANNAIMALETALSTLVRADRPKFSALQRAINTDLDRLRAQPIIDVPVVSARLDSLITLVSRAPLLVPDMAAPKITAISAPAAPGSSVSDSAAAWAAAKNATPAAIVSGAQTPAVQEGEAAAMAGHEAPITSVTDLDWWRKRWTQSVAWSRQASLSVLTALAHELSGVVSIQRVSDANALLMSPEQGSQLRANLRTRLLTAQMALLMHQPSVWRTELAAVEASLAERFDPKAVDVIAANRLVRELAAMPVAIASTDIVDSLSALEAVRLSETSSNKSGN
jgi:uroporphyrin-3 C-methyltransferase